MIRQFVILVVPVVLLGQERDSLRLENYFSNSNLSREFQGTILIVEKNKPLFAKSVGFANVERKLPNTETTKFRIGSCSKQFTAIAILQLQEQGKLSVSDRLSMYFPEVPGSTSITLDMLLTHRSGLHDFYNDSKYERLNTPKMTKSKIFEMITKSSLDYPPGTKYSYSNPGYFLLGQIIEKVSNQTFDEYIMQNVFEKAKMYDSGVDHNDSNVPDKAKGYILKRHGVKSAPFDNMDAIAGCGNLYSTSNDIYKYFIALNDTTLLSDRSRKQLITPPENNFVTFRKQSFGKYAYGVMADTLNSRPVVRHGGACYGFTSEITMYLKDEVLFVVLSNNEWDVRTLSRHMQSVLFNRPELK
jgi:CubicO group peptidase (beta-lactamase class C family)